MRRRPWMFRGHSASAAFGRWTNAPCVWLVDKKTGEIREITGDEYNRMGRHPNGWDHFGVSAHATREGAESRQAKIEEAAKGESRG